MSQFAGGFLGAGLANLMFGLDAVSVAARERSSGGLWLGEVIATLGLLLVIFGTVRAGRGETVAYAVGGYITAAYWFLSSTSFANPAVTVSRMFSDTFTGIAPSSAPMFVLMQLVGGLLGLFLIKFLYPCSARASLNTTSPRMSPLRPRPTRSTRRERQAHRPARLRAQRRPFPDGAGYLSQLAGDRVAVRSAGSAPADQVNPVAVEAMAEEGIDILGATPKILTTDAVQESDVVVTMGCGDTCPIFPGKRDEDWELGDPAGQGIEAVRPIRDEIKNRVEKLLSQLLPSQG